MGIYPLPAALSGYPPRGVSAAQGQLMPLAFASPLRPPVVVCSNPATLMHEKPRTFIRHGAFR